MSMRRQYDPKTIEKKWQKHWEEKKTFKAEIDNSKPKYYVLDMFPYPSGSGLHVGHVAGYTATDILARYRRQLGFNVLHPMGWDSFGLPAEQYAIRTGTHPAETTQANIDNFRRQLKSLGYSYDWDREVTTSHPDYYKWTQWIFGKLYEKGLAYQAEMLVNYCPALGTVLANEEVENGRSVEGGHLVERRPLKQWILKITAYAERLITDLDLVDWPPFLKRLQINWIGKSEGTTVHFTEEKSGKEIAVFTTRADTLFGATFLVLAPEHPLVERITSSEQSHAVKEYRRQASLKSDMERAELTKEKNGVFTGSYAVNPLNGCKLPIWISDYVLMGYGTGAIMAVPCHDERDFAFAQKFHLPVKAILDPSFEAHPDLIPGDTSLDLMRKEILAGKRCWMGEGKYIHSNNAELSLEGMTMADAKHAVTKYLEERSKGQSTVSYKLRDWLFSRQRYWGEPFPILHFEDGSRRLLSEDELPLCPPEVTDYKPAGDGRSPLAKVKKWVEIVDDKTGKKALRETDTMPQWAGSCWYYLRFVDPLNSKQAWSEEAERYWLPVDMYIGGVEHAVLHLLYARFWHKVLYDCGYVSTLEPFHTLRNPGIVTSRSYQIASGAYVAPEEVREENGQYFHRKSGEKLRSQIEKMSKSKLNGVSPDEIIDEYGADALRLYEMFMGPLDKEKVWNTDAVTGCYRFLSRFYDMAVSDKVVDEDSAEALKLGHRLVHSARNDIEQMSFNTVVAKMMEFVNGMNKLESYPRSVLKMAAQVLAPLAPHLAEEVWEILGENTSLAYEPLPEVDARYLEDETITYIIQVNGKLRGRLDLPKDQGEEKIVALAKDHTTVARYLDGSEVLKVVFVPNRLLNFVVK